MNSLIKAEKNETETPSREDILSSLSKSFSLLADSSHAIDLRRRKNFKSELKEEYKPLCADNNPVMELLFGNDLGKDAKELTDQKKTVLVKNVQKRKTWYKVLPFFRIRPRQLHSEPARISKSAVSGQIFPKGKRSQTNNEPEVGAKTK